MMFDNVFEFVRAELAILACVLSIVYYFTSRNEKVTEGYYRELPPGPSGVPVLGYLPFLTKNPHLKIQQLARTYGAVIRLKIGSRTVIVLSSGKAVRQLFHRQELAERPTEDIYNCIHLNSPLFANGNVWQEHRKFTLRAFRMLGLGKTKVQELLQNEIQRLLQKFSEKCGEPFDPRKLLTVSVANCISLLLHGKTYANENDPELLTMEKLSEDINKPTLGSVALIFPWLKKVPLLDKVVTSNRVRRQVDVVRHIVRKKLQEHKESLERSCPRDFIDTYFCEMEEKQSKEENTTLSESELPDSVLLLYAAGSETILTTIRWTFYTMAAYPEVQAKVQNEIDSVIGRERTLCYSDKQNMPFTQSVLMEVQRWRTAVPINFPRVPSLDVIYDGCVIPAGAYVIANLWAIHHDPECWEKPDEFVAERFLGPDKVSVVSNENYMPFGNGKRSCIGEDYAVVAVFLYFASVLQKFEVRTPDKVRTDMDGLAGIIYLPKPQKLCFVPRWY